MDEEGERKKKPPPSLPPDYVSLAQLRERWLQKQQEKKLKDEIKQNAGNQNQNQGAVTDGTMETDARQMGLIDEEIEKGKEKENKNKKQKKNYWKKKKQSMVDGKRENHKSEDTCYSEELDGETDKRNECNEVEIIPKNESKVGISTGESSGGGDTASVSVPNARRTVRFKSGYQKNGDNRGSNGPKEYRVKPHEAKDNEAQMSLEKKVEGEKRKGRKYRRDRRRTGDNRDRNHRFENSAAEIHESKGNEVGQDSEEMAKSEILEVGIKLDCLKVIDNNEPQKQDHSVLGERLDDNQIELEKKTQDETSVANRATEAGDEFGRYRNRSGNVGRKFGRPAFSDRRSNNVRSRMDMNAVGNRNYAGSGKFGGRKMNRRDNDMVWVKKGDKSGANAAEVESTGTSLDQA